MISREGQDWILASIQPGGGRSPSCWSLVRADLKLTDWDGKVERASWELEPILERAPNLLQPTTADPPMPISAPISYPSISARSSLSMFRNQTSYNSIISYSYHKLHSAIRLSLRCPCLIWLITLDSLGEALLCSRHKSVSNLAHHTCKEHIAAVLMQLNNAFQVFNAAFVQQYTAAMHCNGGDAL